MIIINVILIIGKSLVFSQLTAKQYKMSRNWIVNLLDPNESFKVKYFVPYGLEKEANKKQLVVEKQVRARQLIIKNLNFQNSTEKEIIV